jgi:hypothetical protein
MPGHGGRPCAIGRAGGGPGPARSRNPAPLARAARRAGRRRRGGRARRGPLAGEAVRVTKTYARASDWAL